MCNLCKGEGHIASECSVNRLIFAVQTMSVDDAWKAIEQADNEKDVDDIKTVRIYPLSRANWSNLYYDDPDGAHIC